MFLDTSSTEIFCFYFLESQYHRAYTVAGLKTMGQDPCVSKSNCCTLRSSLFLAYFAAYSIVSSQMIAILFFSFLFFPWKSWPWAGYFSSSTGSSVTSDQFFLFIGHMNFIRNSISDTTVRDNLASSMNQTLPMYSWRPMNPCHGTRLWGGLYYFLLSVLAFGSWY